MKNLALISLALMISSGNVFSVEAVKPVRALPTEATAWKGELDGMIERRLVRVLVPYSRTLYYNDKGQERGVTADIFRHFEIFINQKYRKELGNRPITVLLVPTSRDKLLQNVSEGFGDIAAGNITYTDKRNETCDFFVPPNQAGISELVLTGPKAAIINTVDDLAGKTIHVRKETSYYESLMALNERFKTERKTPVRVVTLPDELEDEDMMELLNAGIIDMTVIDDWMAKLWSPVLPEIKVHETIVVRQGGNTGWALRKNSPKLKGLFEEFFPKWARYKGIKKDRVWNYSEKIKRPKDPTSSAEYKRFEKTIELFKKYGAKYDFDPLMVAAQGYQESKLKQEARSHMGAVGIMQVLPSTGADMKVGDIHTAEANVHAGVKYMNSLLTQYFKDANFDYVNHSLFAFAAYNAGPGNIAKMRKEAVKRSLDPDVWFNNVEIVTASKIGIETTTYVRNIYKYYIAYKLIQETEAAKKETKEGLKETTQDPTALPPAN